MLLLQPCLLFSAFQALTQYSHFCWNNTNILCEVPSTSPQLDVTLLSSLLLKTVVQATVSIHNHLIQSFSVDFLDLLSHDKFLEGRITIFLIALSSIFKNEKLWTSVQPLPLSHAGSWHPALGYFLAPSSGSGRRSALLLEAPAYLKCSTRLLPPSSFPAPAQPFSRVLSTSSLRSPCIEAFFLLFLILSASFS